MSSQNGFSWLYARTIFYPTLWWNMLLGRWLKVRNWWDEVDDEIVLGAFPFASDVKGLANIGVKGVVNTCEEYGGPTPHWTTFAMPSSSLSPMSIKETGSTSTAKPAGLAAPRWPFAI